MVFSSWSIPQEAIQCRMDTGNRRSCDFLNINTLDYIDSCEGKTIANIKYGTIPCFCEHIRNS